MTSSRQIILRLKALGSDEIARHSQRFFKTGKGEYGEGDLFLGIRVPVIRQCVKEWRDLPLDVVLEILQSPFHEARLLALLIMVKQYAAGSEQARNALYRVYLHHTACINNWDLVDCSAEHVVGAHLFTRSRAPLYRLAKSESLWERRIALLATFHFIRRNDFEDLLKLAEMLLPDREDLIHKAAGWMLREVGKRDRSIETEFLERHARSMPRTMLRYAIERFPESARQRFLHQ
ncbi:MAG TPA: DNA alkylation repair protein [Kiritimatiellia bacterium]|nr:DNA alkylation repair protein [Kiritimatiellia bacterium]HNS81115.1 DNA alkylation repair protein [Kiritimatiellia bacterium]HPA77241.1 DNA alkylation repair protein [Kiritimatiellia bacterium]HQQ03271.1 DNA alkylation repair protein [Kiritimatiellia bacterium]